MIAPLITPDTAAIWSDSERCLIGSMLVWPEGGHLDAAHTAGVTAAAFHTPANHRIVAAIEAISARGEIADTAAVCAELGPRLELVGGYAELGALEAAAPPTSLHVPRLVAAVRDAALRRRINTLALTALEGVRDASMPVAEIVSILGSAADTVSPSGWTVRTADAMAAEPEAAPPELVRGLLYQGGTMMLSGASKSMKSYTMIALGLAVASGRDWLGFRCNAAPVLFLNLELQTFAMEARTREVAAALGINPPPGFMAVHLRGELVNVDTLEKMLRPLLKRFRPGLVIVDPHYKISSASGVEENSNDAQGLLLYRLENLVCPTGAALTLAHHFSKGDKSQTRAIDRAAGGGALARWPDVVMTLTEHNEAACASVEMSLRNFAPVEPFAVRWKYPLWSRDGTLDPSKLKKAGRPSEHSAADVAEKLKDGMTGKEWREAAKLADSTFRRKRDQLEDEGKIRSVARCYYHVVTP
uniref:AAA family ATPase n=1 Tax=Limnohabitans sp. TaxID=1907725 RepID=UPI0040470609